MTKVVIPDIDSGYNLTQINVALQALATELNNKVLYRDNPVGEPNSMDNNLDMNSFQILNLPAPATQNSPARLRDVQAAIVGLAPASLVPFTPAGTISATTVQAAIEEASTDAAAGITGVFTELASVASGKGDAYIGVRRTEAGSVATTQHAINQERAWYPVPDSGAVGDDSADDTAELQAALDASLYVDLGDARRKYKISGILTLRTGHVIRASGAEIRQVTSNTEIFNAEGKSDITIMGVIARGVGTDYTDSDSSRAVFLYCGTSGSRITVAFCKLYGFSYATVRAQGNSVVTFCHNYVQGPGEPTLTPITSGRCYGFLADAGCTDVQVFGNYITKMAQGVRIERTARFVITGNVIRDITGQHGAYLGSGLTDGVIANNNIDTVDLIGIKAQAANDSTDNRRILIADNTITNCGDQGILTCNGGGGTAQAIKNRSVTISGNVIRTTGGSGINVQNTIGAVVSGNSIDGATFSGINVSASSRVTFSSNVVENCALSGIRDESPSTQIVVESNQVRDCATANTTGDRYGIFVQDMTEWTIRDNIVSDAAAKMQYGIYCVDGNQTTLVLEFNQILNATDTGLRLKNSTDSVRIYRGNLWAGTIAPVFNEPAVPTVASASTITIPQGWEVAKISGTTSITTINAAGHAGRTVRLVFSDALTVTDGSNLLLAGNFVTTANDVIVLSCDGSNWYENSRSVN